MQCRCRATRMVDARILAEKDDRTNEVVSRLLRTSEPRTELKAMNIRSNRKKRYDLLEDIGNKIKPDLAASSRHNIFNLSHHVTLQTLLTQTNLD